MYRKLFICLLSVFILPLHAAQETGFLSVEGESFQDYIHRAGAYIQTHKEWINKQDKERELAAVMPFELLPDPEKCSDKRKTGVLLSHGLSDSPYSMRDVASAFQKACFQVRVILLPGHGTKADDLLSVTRDQWRDMFKDQANQFAREVDALYVGGFSTGGALAAEYAWKNESNVLGVVLFSPVFKINSQIDWLSPWLAPFIDWLDHDPNDDFAKYASIPVPAIAQVYKLAKETRKLILDHPKAIPVFMALSEDDQTVDSKFSQDVFINGMTSTRSRMILYSRRQTDAHMDRIQVFHSDWPERKIFGLSHMAIHGSPDNPYYGEHGEYRVCGWYFSDESLYKRCRTDKANWYGEKSDELMQKSPYAARVSWNPNFDPLMQKAIHFMRVNMAAASN